MSGAVKSVVDSKDATKKMRQLGADCKEVRLAIARAVFSGVLLIQGRARMRVLKGPKSGIIYGPIRLARIANTGGKLSNGQARKVHQASAPGEAPANETGNLARGIIVTRATESGFGVYTAQVQSTAKYAAALEYGTRKAGKSHSVVILERPYMRPSIEESKAEINTLIRYNVAKAIVELKAKNHLEK